MSFDIAYWKGRTHDLGRMDLGDLVRVFFTYPAVIAYLVLGAFGAALSAATAEAVWPPITAVGLTLLAYPPVEYLLHRFVLHGRYLYKSALTASVWKRIHFDHHQDPHDLRVLFGALHTTLPTIALVTLPIGYAVGGFSGVVAAFTTGALVTCGYEFVHCVQHLNYVPKSAFLQRTKRLHMAHHFHNETGNFGITSPLCDILLGTLYERPKDVPRSETVFNLGYTAEESARYPWVARTSAPVTAIGAHRERGRRMGETGETPARQGQG